MASAYRENVKCGMCGSAKHLDHLHLSSAEKKERAKEAGTVDDSQDNVDAKCTSVCEGAPGGLSCSKSALVDIYGENHFEAAHRAYTIMDDQSNASIISTGLADKLNADSPEWRYFLSMCGSNKEVRYGRRVTNILMRSKQGTGKKLRTLIDEIPRDREEILTPEIVRTHPHLRSMADKIPPLDEVGKIQLLIGRDEPELIKMPAFKNGPKGVPWA